MYLHAVTSKNAVSYYILESTYEKGKHSSRVVEKLGTFAEMTERANGQEPLAWASGYVAELNAKKKAGKQAIIVKLSSNMQIAKNEAKRFNIGYLFLKSIYHGLGLDKLCKELQANTKQEYDLDAVVSRLVYTRILYPSSKLSSWESSHLLMEPPMFDLQHIYRALDVIEANGELIESWVYEASKRLVKRNTGVLYYDCTNYFFEIEEEDTLRQYGKSKEHRPNPIVQMGLFIDGSGIPLAMCVTPGAMNEQPTLKPIEERIAKDFSVSKFIVCTDGGLGSLENRKMNNITDRAFVTTQSLKKLKGFLKTWALAPEGWRILGEKGTYDLHKIDDTSANPNTYYKERWMKEDGLEQKLVVTYSPKYKAYQRHVRHRQIERAQRLAENPGRLKHKREHDPARLLTQTHVTPDGEVAGQQVVSLNEAAIAKEEKYDGFYGVCTNLEEDVHTILKINRGRWEIEESFRILKSEFRARPVHHWKENRIKAHFTTCFLSLLVYRILEKKLGERFTVCQIIDTLRSMDMAAAGIQGYVPAYQRTDLTDALHDTFGFRTDWEVTPKKTLTNILKASKKTPTLFTSAL